MKEGDVIIAPMPQADGAVKNRPALILREMPPFQYARLRCKHAIAPRSKGFRRNYRKIG